jgi:hypothetical protein
MKNTTKLFLIGLIFFPILMGLFASCDKDDDNGNGSLEGVYYTSLIRYWDYENNELVDNGEIAYDPATDPDLSDMELTEFTEDQVVMYYDESGTSYEEITMDYTYEDGKMVMSGYMYGEYFSMTYSVEFSGDNIILTYTMTEDEYMYRAIVTLKPYNGEVPPASWLVDSSNDSYEPDNTYQEATTIIVGGGPQYHITTEGDHDWYKFTASAGNSYLMQVSGMVDHVLVLYDTDGQSYLDSDDDNDAGLEINTTYWGNPVLLWNCQSSGTYYFNILGYDESDEGDYSIEVTLSNLKAADNKPNKIKKDKNKLNRYNDLRHLLLPKK